MDPSSHTKQKVIHLPVLPPELWIHIFQHATHVPGTLIPDIYDNASIIGPLYAKIAQPALREALLTKRALVRVCRQWWHLAIPYLYRSVYIGRVRCLLSLSRTLVYSAAGKATVTGVRPLGEYTERLDITIRDHARDADAEYGLLAALITRMPHLAIVSFAVTASYADSRLSDRVTEALEYSAASLRVLDWSLSRFGPSAYQIVDLLAKCTQLRVLNCPQLAWSKEFQHGVIPPTLTTLRLGTLVPFKTFSTYSHVLKSDPSTLSRPGSSALHELIVDISRGPQWEDFLHVYGSQIVSVQFHIPQFYESVLEPHLQTFAQTCPRLRRLTITSDDFSSFIRPDLIFLPMNITYLGLHVFCAQSSKSEFKLFFVLLEKLRSGSSVPSLQVVQLLNEHNVQRLLKMHTKFAARALQPFMESASMPFRVVDKDGVLLTDRLKALECL